jgi:pyruvate kinase
VAAFRPSIPIVALALEPHMAGSLALLCGVIPLTGDFGAEHIDVGASVDAATAAGLVKPGTLVAVVAGARVAQAGATDFVRIVRA